VARPGDPEALLVRRRGALRAGIGDDPRELGPDRRLDRGDPAGPRGPARRRAGQRLPGCPERPAPAAPERGRDAPLDAELVGLRGLALADALDLGRVQGRDLAAPLTLALVLDAPGQRQRPGEGLGEVGPMAILRATSRITRPSLVRRRRSALLARLNGLAWA
jgi:hypothetical protein